MNELQKTLQLLKIEQEEDYKNYQQNVEMTPLHERKKKGLTWYPIEINHTEIGTGENFYLSMDRKSQIDESSVFQVGDMVALFSNSNAHKKMPSVNGVISALWRNTMKVAFNFDELPDWIDDGSLGIDLMFDNNSYKEMEWATKKVIEAKDDRLAELRQVLFGNAKAGFKEDFEMMPFEPIASLNASQNQAIENILRARDVAIIHGPPGTGKTTTIVEAVKKVLEREKQVLVTAPSNTATDLLTEKLAQKGLKVIRIGNPARISQDLIEHSLETQISYHSDFKYLKNLRKQAEEYKALARKYKRNFGADERQQRKLLFSEAYKMLEEAKVLEKYITDNILSEAQVITATLVGSTNKYIKYRRFSTIFIDESAQALEPACWIPITKADRVVFAGDHCQLPPTVKSYEAGKQGLSETLFEKCIHRSMEAGQKVDVMLTTQYRMHADIMNFSNAEFYHNQLIAAENVKSRTLIPEGGEDFFLQKSVEFIDTAGCGFEEIQESNLSRSNPEEANLLFRHLDKLFAHIYQNYKSILDTDFSVGIISPYKAQVNFIRENLKLHPELKDFQEFIDVNSVDGFQGQERDVIYISLVRSNEEGKIGFLEDTRRMNVAMTRAKKKLVIFGDSATISTHPFYQNFLNYIEKIAAYQSAWEWVE